MDMELTGSANCLASGVQVGEYRLQGVVGEGGFGIVYRARDLSLDRIVAIKEYMPSTLAGRMSSNQIHVRAQHKGAFDAGLRSFINEARLLAKFSHPALVHVYRFFEENGTAYMVMRYYEGQTFRAFLAEQENGMNERWLSSMLSPILDVLEMLHAADCFHRDIAPDNVFLQASGMPVLLDFGAARRIIGDMTQALTMVLKPGFAPIEQYADDGGMPQGAWTDIYQLGAMLYLAITGKVPTTSVARMISDPIRMLTPADYPGFSAQFLQGVHRALAVKPSDRPQSIAELKGLLGIRTFTAPALSAWSASSAMPLDMFAADSAASASGDAVTLGGAGATAERSLPAGAITVPVAAVDKALNEAVSPPGRHPVAPNGAAELPGRAGARTTAAFHPTGEAAQDSPPGWSQRIVTIPLPASTDVAKAYASGGLNRREDWAETTLEEPTGTNVAQRTVLRPTRWSWKAAALIGAVVLLLTVGWILTGGNAAVDDSPTLVSDAASWGAAKKERTVASVQAYLDAFPAGEHVLEARSMLVLLTQEAAVTDPTAGSMTPQRTPAEPAPEARAASAAAIPPVAVQAPPPVLTPPPTAPVIPTPVIKPAPPAVIASAPLNTNPGVIRPPVEPPKADVAAPVLADTKRPVPAEMGKVTLRVTPWGNVRVNRSPVGTTPPLNQLDLPEGQHQIEISNPAGPSVTRVVQVKKGEPVVLSHKFE